MTTMQKESGYKMLTTTLLSICTAGVLWGAKELNSLDSRVARIEVSTGYNSDNIVTVQSQQRDHSLHLNSLDLTVVGITARVVNLENNLKSK